ncbi:MAG: plasmid partitioning protein RepB [Pseudomonadota bacterium]|nr:plasmid partitioning protein RepB [Pseudomonadota bacterium]
MVKRKDALRALLSGSSSSASEPDAETGPASSGKPGEGVPAPGASLRDDAKKATASAMPEDAASDSSPETTTTALPRSGEHVRSGAINAMRQSWGEMAREAEAAKALRAEAATGGRVVLVDPDLILPSPVTDRLSRSGDLDAGFEALKASISAGGQTVPVLLRPHADEAKRAEGYYETAYGHRRVRAARELGLHVRAIVRPLSDEELILAQGRENAERRDLSFIERAFFAKGLEGAGFSRETIGAAIGVDKTELTRLLQVASRIPQAIAAAIGPAPKVGRPRWGELGELMMRRGASDRAFEFISRESFSAIADSDARFRALLKRMHGAGASAGRAGEEAVKGAGGATLAVMKRGEKKRMSLAFATDDGADFARFVADRLPKLYETFLAEGAADRAPREDEEADAGG